MSNTVAMRLRHASSRVLNRGLDGSAPTGVTVQEAELAADVIDRLAAENERLRAIVNALYEGLDNVALPDPEAKGREWNPDFNTYHRGCVLLQATLTVEEWDAFERAAEAAAKEDTQ